MKYSEESDEDNIYVLVCCDPKSASKYPPRGAKTTGKRLCDLPNKKHECYDVMMLTPRFNIPFLIIGLSLLAHCLSSEDHLRLGLEYFNDGRWQDAYNELEHYTLQNGLAEHALAVTKYKVFCLYSLGYMGYA